jgi:phospholipase/carboxylesterase
LSLRNYVGVAPAAAMVLDPSRASPRNDRLPATDPHSLQDPVFDAVDAAARRYHVHPRRVFLAGHGPGGAAALRLALAAPQRFAGVLSFCGPFPTGGAPLCSLAAARRMPVFLATARDSTAYSPAEAARHVRLLLCAGIEATHRVYPGDDALGSPMLADANRWMMGIVTGSQAA